MKLQLSIALAAATLFAGAAFAADEPIKVFGLDKLHWGINAADTRAAVPSLKIHSQLAGESELLNETFVYSGCRFRLSLLFTDDRLTNLSVVSAENDPGCNLNIKHMIDRMHTPGALRLLDLELTGGEDVLDGIHCGRCPGAGAPGAAL